MIPEFWHGPTWTFWVSAVLAYLFLCIYAERWLKVLVWSFGALISLPFVPGFWLVQMVLGALEGEEDE